MPADFLALIAVPAFLSGPVPHAFPSLDTWLRLQTEAVEAIEAGEPVIAREKLTAARDYAEQDGVPHLFFEKCMIDLADAQLEHGYAKRAEYNYRRAYIVRAARLGEMAPATGELLRNLATSCFAQGKTELAQRMMEGVLDIQVESFGKNDARLSEPFAELGVLQLQQGNWYDAAKSFTRAYECNPTDERAVQLWVAHSLAGNQNDADALLDNHLSSATATEDGSDHWSGLLLGHLRGEVSSETLLTNAQAVEDPALRNARQFDAHFCIGWSHLLIEQRVIARDMFEICRNLTAGSPIARRLVSADVERTWNDSASGDLRITNVEPGAENGF